MKTIKLQEAASLGAYDKMLLFDAGQRRENLKACNIVKLFNYYRICLNNGFNSAERQIAAELCDRGAGAYTVPQVAAIDSTQFTPYEAQYILKHKDNPALILDAALLHPFPHLTESETLLVYLIWAIVLELPLIVDSIKKQIKSYNTYYYRVPDILNDILKNAGTTDIIFDIIKKLP